ncbi:MAG: MFS transporter [Candidatus Heimdallarchaeota archaeon]|nr:MAG: MFS transporter [Candidatus Heimdallarchaeota archaeon]
MVIYRYLSIESLPEQTRSLTMKFLIIQLLNSFLFSLSSTFYILNAIDKIGFTQAAIITSVMLLIQLMCDFPSGSLGDYIGQKWVMTLAYTCYGVAFFLLSIAGTFPIFILIAIFNGLGNAQSSGTIEAWFDSNYKRTSKNEDIDRKVYGIAKDRVALATNISLAVSFMIGGILATVFSRQLVFFLQFSLTTFLIVYTSKILADTDPKGKISEEEKPSYFQYLKGGVKFMLLSKTTFLFIIGLAIYQVTWLIWGSLILFPLYFGYTGSDFGTSIIRTIIFLLEIPARLYVAKWSIRFKNDQFPIFLFLHLSIFFPAYLILFSLLPPQNRFNLIGFIATIVIMNISNSFVIRIAYILRDRITIDLVPSEVRNSVYSLIPTLISVFGIPLLVIAGQLVENSGLIAGVAFAFGICITGSSILFISLKLRPVVKMAENTQFSSSETVIGG